MNLIQCVVAHEHSSQVTNNQEKLTEEKETLVLLLCETEELPCPPTEHLEQAMVSDSRPGEADQHIKRSQQKTQATTGLVESKAGK
jgi:hypothetical protein